MIWIVHQSTFFYTIIETIMLLAIEQMTETQEHLYYENILKSLLGGEMTCKTLCK
jgi:hypothetical protein